MNRSLRSIAIILTLGSFGCAGFGIQHSSSLAPQLGADRGVAPLWYTAEQESTGGLEPPAYGEQQLDALWDTTEHAPPPPVESSPSRSAASDLWNPASSRGWQVADERPARGYQLSRSTRGLWY